MEWGTLFDCQAGHVLAISQAIESFEAVCDHPLYEFIELRYIDQNSRRSEIVIVDCVTHVASRNQAGIKHKERLALCFFEQAKIRPEVRSLREDFPATWHQNHVLEGEPASLCFELSEWALSRRSWTAAKFLRQILVWLQETASGTLHKNEQPLEPFFFENRRCRLVLPADYDEKIDTEEWSLRVAPKNIYRDEYETFSSVFIHNGESSQDGLDFHTIAIRTPTVLHGRVEHTPHKLGELHDQLAGRGVDLAKLMYESLRQQSEGVGIAASNKKFTLLVLSIPLSRDAEMVAEKIHTRGFILSESLESIGTRSGVLRLHEEKYRFTPTIGADGFTRDDWREVIINPIELLNSFTKQMAREASGIASAGPSAVIAGLGALGSAMQLIWARLGWGEWVLVDPDVLNPHNLARHIGFETHIGSFKVDVVRNLQKNIFTANEEQPPTIHLSAAEFECEAVKEALINADLVVDATTTLEIPRELANKNSVARVISVFITPSGHDAVLIAEDAARNFRSDLLEAQYYRSVIGSSWGKEHLCGHLGHLWVGAGCRDSSLVISNDLVQMQAALLARQVRLVSMQPYAVINIWRCDPGNGEVVLSSINTYPTETMPLGDYTLVWDEEVKLKLRHIRTEHLPNETGGILLGYYDHILSKVYVVDACSAPSDSLETESGFIRGKDGLDKLLAEVLQRTANIVGYIGEWHSHPVDARTTPSAEDLVLLAYLTKKLEQDGLPALMLIVGEGGEHWSMGS